MSISILFLPVALLILDRAEQMSEHGASPQDASVRFSTSFTDANLLLKALRDFGTQPVQTDVGDIFCRIGESELRFAQQDGQAFFVEIQGAPSTEEVSRHLVHLNEDYRRCVQTAVYEKVKTRAESQGMTLENEEVLEDKTILMTLRIR